MPLGRHLKYITKRDITYRTSLYNSSQIYPWPYLKQTIFLKINLQPSLNLLSINAYIMGFTTLLMVNDLVTIGNTADTIGPGGNRNLPFNAVNKDIVKCGRQLKMKARLTANAILVSFFDAMSSFVDFCLSLFVDFCLLISFFSLFCFFFPRKLHFRIAEKYLFYVAHQEVMYQTLTQTKTHWRMSA